MLSLDLRQILHQKRHFSFVKNFATNHEVPNFIKFHQKSIFLSRRPVFVTSSVFCQKGNPFEPTDQLMLVLNMTLTASEGRAVRTSSCMKDTCKADLACVCSEREFSANSGLDKSSRSTDTDSGSLQRLHHNYSHLIH